jgi:hypothetical protein
MTQTTDIPDLNVLPAACKGRFRRRLLATVTPFIEPGEVVRSVVWVRHGPAPIWNAARLLSGAQLEHYAIVVTDRALVVLDVDMSGRKLFGPARRMPHNSLGSFRRSFVHARACLAGERIWIFPQFVRDARAAVAPAT